MTNKKNNYKKVMEAFKKFNDPKYDNSDYEKTYNDIRVFYEERLKNNTLNIKFEKIRLEHYIGNYNSSFFVFDISYFIAIIAVLFSLLMQQTLKLLKLSTDKSIYFALIFSIIIFVLGFRYTAIKDRRQDFMIYLSLKVIEDMEQDIIEAQELELEQDQEEVAVTLDERVFKINNFITGILDVIKVFRVFKK